MDDADEDDGCDLLADCDGDGVGDATDEFDTDASEDTDSDGDGKGDNGAAIPTDATEANATEGQLHLTPGALSLKAILYALGLAVLPFTKHHPVTAHVSEYFALILLATLGMGFVVTSRNLLGAFVALELVSLSLYAMTVLNQARRGSAEAALK